MLHTFSGHRVTRYCFLKKERISSLMMEGESERVRKEEGGWEERGRGARGGWEREERE